MSTCGGLISYYLDMIQYLETVEMKLFLTLLMGNILFYFQLNEGVFLLSPVKPENI